MRSLRDFPKDLQMGTKVRNGIQYKKSSACSIRPCLIKDHIFFDCRLTKLRGKSPAKRKLEEDSALWLSHRAIGFLVRSRRCGIPVQLR